MKLPKILFLLYTILIINITGFAQKKTYDIVSYSPPKDWTEQQGNGNVSYSRIDGASWAQIAIYQHRQSVGDIQTDFDKDWNELVAPGRSISGMEKTKPQTAEGWTVMSGSGIWQYNGSNVASVLTVYSNKQVCVAVLCNSTAMPYMKIYQSLIGSLDIDAGKISTTSETETNTSTIENANASTENISASNSVIGLWTDYVLETTGFYINGRPQYTSGYLRKEYRFNADGTYTFRNKQWLTKALDIIFIYETGTYTVNGNQLTLTPKKGKSGFWAKTSSSKEWGKLKKYVDYDLEKTTYSFEILIDPNYSNKIVLKPGKPTARDGGKFNAAGDPFEFRYSFRELESLIDNPPGFEVN